MEDVRIIGNRTNSFFRINVSGIDGIDNEWKEVFGNIQPFINLNSTCEPKVINRFIDKGFPLGYLEKTYFDQVSSQIEKDKARVYDLSGNTIPVYLDSLVDKSLCSVVANNSDSLKVYAERKMTQSVIIRLCSTTEPCDLGCTLEELDTIMKEATAQSLSISCLCISCNKVAEASHCLQILEQAVEVAKKHNVTISSFLIVGDGMQHLAKGTDSQSKEALAHLLSLSSKYSISVDASRFFTASIYTIYVRIIGKKYKANDKDYRILYYTNNGVYCSFYISHIYNESLKPIPISMHGVDFAGKEQHISTIFGPTCDSIDCLGKEFVLPDLEIGDWFKYENNGYTCSNFSTRFNGFEDPDVLFDLLVC